MVSALAFQAAIVICNSAKLSECKTLIGFRDAEPGFTVEVCRKAMALDADEWLKVHFPKWFVSGVVCGVAEERGA